MWYKIEWHTKDRILFCPMCPLGVLFVLGVEVRLGLVFSDLFCLSSSPWFWHSHLVGGDEELWKKYAKKLAWGLGHLQTMYLSEFEMEESSGILTIFLGVSSWFVKVKLISQLWLKEILGPFWEWCLEKLAAWSCCLPGSLDGSDFLGGFVDPGGIPGPGGFVLCVVIHVECHHTDVDVSSCEQGNGKD